MRFLLPFATLLLCPALTAASALYQPHAARLPCGGGVEHTPAPDIAYTPNVDARGNKLAPAEINPPEGEQSQSFDIPLAVPLSGYVKNNHGVDFSQSDIPVGTVHVDPHGSDVTVLGQHQKAGQAVEGAGCR